MSWQDFVPTVGENSVSVLTGSGRLISGLSVSYTGLYLLHIDPRRYSAVL